MSLLTLKCYFLFVKQRKNFFKKVKELQSTGVTSLDQGLQVRSYSDVSSASMTPPTAHQDAEKIYPANELDFAVENRMNEIESNGNSDNNHKTGDYNPDHDENNTSGGTAGSNGTVGGTSSPSQKTLFSSKHSPCIAMTVKIMLISISSFYLTFGTCFISTVFIHFDESKQECNNPKSIFTLVEHPEVYLWDQCLYKTYPFPSINFWSSDNMDKIICNCRQARVDLSSFATSFSIIDGNIASNSSIDNKTRMQAEDTFIDKYNNSIGCTDLNNLCLMVESMLKYWDMLEILYIIDDIARFGISLNGSNHYNTVHLRMLHLSEIKIRSLGNDIKNWKNLEYFYISHSHFEQWPSTFDQLNKISFFKLQDSYLQSLPSNLCSMKNLQSINIAQSFAAGVSSTIDRFPDCIVDLEQLRSVILYYVTSLEYLPVGLFTMPSIEEIGFIHTQAIDINTMLDLINKTIIDLGSFEWNKPEYTTYSFVNSIICADFVDIYGDLYDEEQFDDLENINLLRQFINSTRPCDSVCDWESPYKVACSPWDWQNGVCNDECNVDDCNYDGGDCNQLCQINSPECYTVGLFGNGACDIACNTSYCDYDRHECIPGMVIEFPDNVTYCNINNHTQDLLDWLQLEEENPNSTESILESISSAIANATKDLCPVEWVNDGWCDTNCWNSDECFDDGEDCLCHELNDDANYCEQLLDLMELTADTTGSSAYEMSADSVCALWDIIPEYDWDASDLYDWDGLSEAIPIAYEMVINMRAQVDNCTKALQYIDFNSDGFVSIDECIQYYFSAQNENDRIQQINCTFSYHCP